MDEMDNEIPYSLEEVLELARAHRRQGPNAFMLLMRVRGEFADHCRAGGTFILTPKVCARTGEPFRWSRERYEITRDVLLSTAHIAKVEPFHLSKTGPRPARYRLTAKGIAPADGNAARRAIAAYMATVMPANTMPA